MLFLSPGLFFFGGTGGHTLPQISCRHLLLCLLRDAALARILSIAVMPSPCAWCAGSASSSQLGVNEFCLADSFWCNLTSKDSMLSLISRISVTIWGGEPGGSQREDDFGRTAWFASWLLRLIISWNFLLRSATRLNSWASRKFWWRNKQKHKGMKRKNKRYYFTSSHELIKLIVQMTDKK